MSILGTRVLRTEDPDLLTIGGKYVDDLVPEGALHATFVRSIMAHADVTEIDTSEAEAMPGVVAVYTAATLGLEAVPPAFPMLNAEMKRTWLAADRYRHARGFGCLFNAGGAAQDNQVGQGNGLVDALSDVFQHGQDCRQFLRIVDAPVFHGGKPNTRSVGAAAHIRSAEAGGGRPSGAHQCGYGQTRVQDAPFQPINVCGIH